MWTPDGLDEEVKRKDMESDAEFLTFQNIISNLDKDELIIFSKLLFSLSSNENVRSIYLAGVAAGYAHGLYETNINCFKSNLDVDGYTDNQPDPSPKEKKIDTPHESFQLYCVRPFQNKVFNYYTTKVICINCNVVYPSLKDRMLSKPGPEGCSGCVAKEKNIKKDE